MSTQPTIPVLTRLRRFRVFVHYLPSSHRVYLPNPTVFVCYKQLHLSRQITFGLPLLWCTSKHGTEGQIPRLRSATVDPRRVKVGLREEIPSCCRVNIRQVSIQNT